MSVFYSPVIVAHCTPSIIDVDLHVAIGEINSVVTGCAVHHKSDGVVVTGEVNCTVYDKLYSIKLLRARQIISFLVHKIKSWELAWDELDYTKPL